MSLVPSKRPDRIFPVLPPLCLLLAAALPVLASPKVLSLTRRSVAIVLSVALLFTGTYVAHGVITGYRSHQDSLKEFGARARAYAGSRPIAVLNGNDEGMLLYVGVPEFTSTRRALQQWRSGSIGLCVIPEREYTKLPETWAPAREVSRSGRYRGKASSYLLIEKE